MPACLHPLEQSHTLFKGVYYLFSNSNNEANFWLMGRFKSKIGSAKIHSNLCRHRRFFSHAGILVKSWKKQREQILIASVDKSLLQAWTNPQHSCGQLPHLSQFIATFPHLLPSLPCVANVNHAWARAYIFFGKSYRHNTGLVGIHQSLSYIYDMLEVRGPPSTH